MNNRKYTIFIKFAAFFLTIVLLSGCSLLSVKSKKLYGEGIGDNNKLVIAQKFEDADYTEPYLLSMPGGKLFVMVFSSNYKQETTYATIKMYIYDPYTGEKTNEKVLAEDDSSWYKDENYLEMGSSYRYGHPKWYGDEIGIYDYLNSEYVFYDSSLELVESLAMPKSSRGALTADRATYYYIADNSLWSYDVKGQDSIQISKSYKGFESVVELISVNLYESEKDGSDYLLLHGYFVNRNYGNMLYSVKDQKMLSISYMDYISDLWLLEDKYVASLNEDYPPSIVFGSYQDIKVDEGSGEEKEGILESGSMEVLSLKDEMSNSLWTYTLEASDNKLFLGEGETNLSEAPDGEHNDDQGYEGAKPDTIYFKMYDMDKTPIGENTSSKEQPSAYTLSFDNKYEFFKFGESIAWLEDGALALVMDDGLKPSLIIWQYEESEAYSPSYETAILPASRTQVIEEPKTIELSEHYKKARDHADKIEEKYGVSICLGEQAELELWDSTSELLTDLDTIENSLKLFEKALAKYPEGFFEQMKDNYGDGVELHLVGTIKGLGATLSNPAAITYTNNPNTMILFDCYQLSEGNVHHELAHAIEGYMNNNSWENPVYTLDKWVSFNPDNFSYGDDYNSDWSSNLEYTLTAYYYGDNSLSDVYFVDGYAKVNNREDVARLFENAMILDPSDSFFKSEHLMDKLAYLSSSIRILFDSSAWPAVTEWEKGLSQ